MSYYYSSKKILKEIIFNISQNKIFVFRLRIIERKRTYFTKLRELRYLELFLKEDNHFQSFLTLSISTTNACITSS